MTGLVALRHSRHTGYILASNHAVVGAVGAGAGADADADADADAGAAGVFSEQHLHCE